MAINPEELENWADVLDIPHQALGETDEEFRVRILRGLRKAPRVYLGEEHIVHHSGGRVQNEWVYHYSDGTTEAVIGGWI